MFFKKIIVLFTSVAMLLGTCLYAKPEHAKKEKKVKIKKEKKIQKVKKQKKLPYGLQKKVNKSGTLPPGWQKKLNSGEIADQRVLDNAIILDSPKYPDIRNTKVYKVQEKIFRVANDTKEILDILK